MREVPLPQTFCALTGVVHYVQQASPTEFSSTCPKCGGSPHANGEWPDRFRLFDDGHPTAWCRRCGYLWYPDQTEGYKPPSAEELAARCQKLKAREEARKRSAERALENLRASNMADRYHEALDDYARRYWLKRGVPTALQDWWRLGWAHEHEFFINGKPLIADAATIPLFAPNWQLTNVKFRLEPAPANAGKYRYAVPGQGEPLFRCDPDTSLDGQHVYAIEGEIKSMVAYAHLENAAACMVGMPGCNPSPDVIATLATAGRVTLVVDPGAKPQGVKIARAIGLSKCWLLETATKIDDAILARQMTARELGRWLNSATKLDAFVGARA